MKPTGITRQISPITLVAIAGTSGSGKSFTANALASELESPCQQIRLDDFYRDLGHLPSNERKGTNFDVPSAIDWATFFFVLNQLRAGKPASCPRYDFGTHRRHPTYSSCQPQELIIVEGLWLYPTPSLRQLYDLTIFIDSPPEVRLKRRIQRDTKSRQRSVADIVEQFESYVRPAESKWVIPQKSLADHIVSSPPDDALTDLIKRSLQND